MDPRALSDLQTAARRRVEDKFSLRAAVMASTLSALRSTPNLLARARKLLFQVVSSSPDRTPSALAPTKAAIPPLNSFSEKPPDPSRSMTSQYLTPKWLAAAAAQAVNSAPETSAEPSALQKFQRASYRLPMDMAAALKSCGLAAAQL